MAWCLGRCTRESKTYLCLHLSHRGNMGATSRCMSDSQRPEPSKNRHISLWNQMMGSLGALWLGTLFVRVLNKHISCFCFCFCFLIINNPPPQKVPIKVQRESENHLNSYYAKITLFMCKVSENFSRHCNICTTYLQSEIRWDTYYSFISKLKSIC